jgi:Ethylbenzene dehydrogenase/Prokaryotic cytochrome b561
MVHGRRPTTDSGTVVIHAIFVVSFVVLLLTGLRIASDDPAAAWLAVLDPILPVEHLWYRHLTAAVIFSAAFLGYVVYVVRARLAARVSLDAARLRAMLRPGKTRWAACNTAVYWLLMASLLVEGVTGFLLFLGTAGPSLAIHLTTTWILLGLIVLHVMLHAMAGGVAQLTRVLRPAPLLVAAAPPDLAELLAEQLRLGDSATASESILSPASSAVSQAKASKARRRWAHPGVAATAVIGILIAAAISFETLTRPSLRIIEIPASEAPVINGDISDPVWMKAPPITVATTQGGDFGGTGSSLVEIRAVHDDRFAYFSFVWSDPTRSLKHQPLIKTVSGWRIAADSPESGNELVYHEDKFAVLLSRPLFPLIGAAIHLSTSPLSDGPASGTGRGMHYTSDGSIADVWVWRASHGGRIGHIDNGHFGAAVKPSKEHLDGRSRYPGGFALDPGPIPYRANIAQRAARANDAPEIYPERLPRDLDSTMRALGRITSTAEQSESEGARWWMTDVESIPYAKSIDDRIPVGTIIPGILMPEDQPMRDDSVRGVARWAAGRWTLEVVRRLHTGSTYDVPIKTGTLMWVAAFDHAETRHSRHLRPIRLEVD